MPHSGPRTPAGRRRRSVPLAGALGVLVAVSAAGGLFVHGLQERWGAEAAFPQVTGQLEVRGIEAPVEIFRDRAGVPHVEAHSERDALFGLGFVHAQDRLAQMQWLARTARGRTAEWIGEKGLAADRLARLLDIAGLAEAEFARLDAGPRALLEAYTAGVNARIERIRDGDVRLPLAFGGGSLPIGKAAEWELWLPEDSLAVLKLYAWGLSGAPDVSLVLSDVVEHLGRYGARRFFPRENGDLPGENDGSITAGLSASSPLLGFGALVPDPLRRAARLEGRSIGSSAWVVSGAHTESGKPILVADAHLPPTAPPLLHVDHFRGGGLDVAGSTLPGVPVVWTGTNGHVAWASTHARAVTTDLYEETLHPDDPDRYHDGRGWRKFRERSERIAVAGGEAEVVTVRSSRHGPIIPAPFDSPRRPLALAWVGAQKDTTSTLTSFLAVARARDASGMLAALSTHHEPPLMMVYADEAGGMGLQVAGWIPRRDFTRGLVPLPGRAGWYGWRGPIPFNELPSVKLSAGRGGWLVAADNRLIRSDGTSRIEWLWRSGERAARIDALIREETREHRVGLRGMARLQTDVRAGRARLLADRALGWLDAAEGVGAEAQEVADLLRDWDGNAGATSVGAAVYHVFLDRLTGKLLTRRLGEELGRRYVSLPQTDPAQLIYELLDEKDSGPSSRRRPFDPAGDDSPRWADSEVILDAIRESLRETWFQLAFDLGPNRSRWHWGRLHPLGFFPFQPGLATGGAEKLGPFPFGGNGSTVNAAEYTPGSFDVRVASTFRFAIDAAALDEALFALAPGESEHPRHPHFSSGLDRWLEGRPTLLATSTLLVEEASASRLTLEPGA